jgi:hypothetical protein
MIDAITELCYHSGHDRSAPTVTLVMKRPASDPLYAGFVDAPKRKRRGPGQAEIQKNIPPEDIQTYQKTGR